MKKGETQSEEQKAALAKGRTDYWEKKRAEKAAASSVTKVEPNGEVKIPPAAITANGHANLLDIADPEKWQMKIRLHLEALDAPAADEWMNKLRLIFQMSGRVVRDQIYRHVTARCYVCKKPFREGRPACEAGYYDADRTYIKIYGCDQSEFGDLLKAVREKEDAIARAEEKAEKAARQALIDSRSASRKEIPA